MRTSNSKLYEFLFSFDFVKHETFVSDDFTRLVSKSFTQFIQVFTNFVHISQLSTSRTRKLMILSVKCRVRSPTGLLTTVRRYRPPHFHSLRLDLKVSPGLAGSRQLFLLFFLFILFNTFVFSQAKCVCTRKSPKIRDFDD